MDKSTKLTRFPSNTLNHLKGRYRISLHHLRTAFPEQTTRSMSDYEVGNLHWADVLIIALYLLGSLGIGIWVSTSPSQNFVVSPESNRSCKCKYNRRHLYSANTLYARALCIVECVCACRQYAKPRMTSRASSWLAGAWSGGRWVASLLVNELRCSDMD